MLRTVTLLDKVLKTWITFILYIPILSWAVSVVVMMAVATHVESLCFNNGFSIWLSSLVTAYGFFLYKLMRN